MWGFLNWKIDYFYVTVTPALNGRQLENHWTLNNKIYTYYIIIKEHELYRLKSKCLFYFSYYVYESCTVTKKTPLRSYPKSLCQKISKIWFTIEHYNGPYWFCHWLNDYKSLQIYPVKKYKAPNFYWADLWAIFKKVMAAQGTKNTMHCLYIITYTHKHNRVMSLFHSLSQTLLWKFPFLLLSTVF